MVNEKSEQYVSMRYTCVNKCRQNTIASTDLNEGKCDKYGITDSLRSIARQKRDVHRTDARSLVEISFTVPSVMHSKVVSRSDRMSEIESVFVNVPSNRNVFITWFDLSDVVFRKRKQVSVRCVMLQFRSRFPVPNDVNLVYKYRYLRGRARWKTERKRTLLINISIEQP